MSKAIDFVKDHFNNYETRKIVVPEWKDENKKPLEYLHTKKLKKNS